MAVKTVPSGSSAQTTIIPILLMVSAGHLVNDSMQTVLSSMYPMFKGEFHLDFVQIGLLTLTFQITASLLQPIVGLVTDRKAMPYALAVGMLSMALGLVALSRASSLNGLLLAAAFMGVGSAIFHPEASRVARLASGGRHGLAQSMFQVGGNAGQAIGPLIAAFFILPFGQKGVLWLSLVTVLGIVLLGKVGLWYRSHSRSNGAAKRAVAPPRIGKGVMTAIMILVALTATKNVYIASLSSYFTFYSIEKFGVTVQQSQLMLFLFLGAVAVGTFLGGPVGDKLGPKFVISFSMLGVIPFALMLPYANLFWTCVLVAVIGIVLSSAFSAILVFAQEMMPGRVGMVAGIFFGLAFGAGGVGAAILGNFADSYGIAHILQIVSYLPLMGVLTLLLPKGR